MKKTDNTKERKSNINTNKTTFATSLQNLKIFEIFSNLFSGVFCSSVVSKVYQTDVCKFFANIGAFKKIFRQTFHFAAQML